MDYLQLIVFIGYFLIIFLIGWISLRKTNDEKDYWIAGGDLGWMIGGATLSATHISAGTFIGTIGVIYTVGWSFGWLIFSLLIGYWIMAAFLAPKFTKIQNLTIPGFIESRYESKNARAIAAIIILMATVVYIVAQIIAGGLVAHVVLGIDETLGMIIFSFILIGYTMVGGMIAVVYTDFIQLIIMVVGVLVAVPMATAHFGGLIPMLESASLFNPKTFTWNGLPGTLLFSMGLAFFLASLSSPEKLIRLYTMKDMTTIRKGILFTIILVTFLNVMVFLIGLAGISMYPILPSGDLLMPLMAKTVLPTFTGTILLAAITSAMMSTVDSLLLVAGSAFSEDLYIIWIKPKANSKEKLRIARIGIFIVGITPLVAILLGFGRGELVQFIVLLFSALMASSFFVPVMFGIWWKKANTSGAIASMIGGVSSTILWKLFGSSSFDPVVAGFLTSLVLMIVFGLSGKPNSANVLNKFFN